MERSFVVPVFVWKCQRASPGRVVGAPADASSTPMIGATSVGTGATMPMTAIASASEAVAAGLALALVLAPGPDPVRGATAPAPAAVATVGVVADLHPIPGTGAGPAHRPVPSRGLQ